MVCPEDKKSLLALILTVHLMVVLLYIADFPENTRVPNDSCTSAMGLLTCMSVSLRPFNVHSIKSMRTFEAQKNVATFPSKIMSSSGVREIVGAVRKINTYKLKNGAIFLYEQDALLQLRIGKIAIDIKPQKGHY